MHYVMSDMSKNHEQILDRKVAFSEKQATRIWQELPSQENPYIAADVRCHGYDFFELIEKKSYVDVFYLMFRGELPSEEDSRMLHRLMIALINPGPRHPATRAAVNTAIGKTEPSHILPIALMTLSGEYLGAKEVEESMRFIRSRQRRDPEEVAAELLSTDSSSGDGNFHLAPGFGDHFGSIDLIPKKTAELLLEASPNNRSLVWANKLANVLNVSGYGWLMTGVAAAVLADLGFHPRAGAGLFQIFSAPGLLAHGLEFVNKPITALPRVSDDDYVIGDAK